METTVSETVNDVTSEVKDILATKLGVPLEALTGSASFTDDLGADSLDVMETFMDIEKHFNIKISDEEAEKLKTVDALLDFIKKQLN